MGYEERREKGREGGRRLINIIAAGWGNTHFMQRRHKQGGLWEWGGAEEKNRNESEAEREVQR